MRKNDIIFVILWNVLSLLFAIFSVKLGLGEIQEPGPGLFPFLAAIILFLVSFCLLLKLLFRIRRKDWTVKEKQADRNFWKIGFVLVSLLFYTLTLEGLGYLIATSLFLILFFRSMGSKWRFTLIASVSTALVTYFVFNYLGVIFPEGIVKLSSLLG